MKVKNHLLYDRHGSRVEWQNTPNKSGHLSGEAPQYVILHYTGGGSIESAVSTFKNRQSKASAHLILGQDGRMVQMGRFNERCWHAGRSEWQGTQHLNNHSVGIELVNWGWLTGDTGQWRAWAGTRVNDENVMRLVHKHQSTALGWERFTDIQIETTLEVVRALLDRYQLTPDAVLGHDDISPGRKQDPGPAFPFARFRSLLEGRNEFDLGPYPEVSLANREIKYRTTAASGLNLRAGPSISDAVLKTLPVNTEVIRLETEGHWWLISELVDGKTETTGWVYSHWVSPTTD